MNEKISPWTRFGARLVDALVLAIPVLLVTVPISGGFQIGSTNNDSDQILATALGVLIAYAYFVLMETNRGATFGKRAFDLEVTAGEGRPTLNQSLQRNAWMLLSIIPGGLGGLISLGFAIAIGVTISRDPDGRGFHDKFAEATIVRRP